MIHIKLQRYEQLYTISDERAIVGVAINLDRKNDVVEVIKNSGKVVSYNTAEVGVINLNTDLESPIKEYDFMDEF